MIGFVCFEEYIFKMILYFVLKVLDWNLFLKNDVFIFCFEKKMLK